VEILKDALEDSQEELAWEMNARRNTFGALERLHSRHADTVVELTVANERGEKWKRKYENDGVCEIGASNLRVASYCGHWEGRAERAESAEKELADERLVVESYRNTIRHLRSDNTVAEKVSTKGEHHD
jgi:hypothetical protein